MIRTLVIATLLFATALALSGTGVAEEVGVSFVEGAAAKPDVCQTFMDVWGLVVEDPNCPHGPTP